MQVRDLQDKVKDLEDLVRGLQVENMTLFLPFLRCKGQRWHRCWPSGPVDGPSGESEEDAGR